MPPSVGLLTSKVTVSIDSPIHDIYGGPSSLLLYALIQGAFTVLAIKEVWSIFHVVIKGRSSALNINKSISWNMVEQFEDLRKTILRVIWPCLRDVYRRVTGKKGSRISLRGWRLVFLSSIFAGILFGFDIALVVLQAPSLENIDANRLQFVTWRNNGPIIQLNASNVLRGSFSRSIILESKQQDIELTRQVSLSLERTDLLDFQDGFNVDLPNYNGTFLTCDRTEGWRMVCKVYTERRLYQYKLRLDLSTDDGSSWYVPVTDFFNASDTRKLSEHEDALRKQLDIDCKVTWNNATFFMLQTTNVTKQPPQYSVLSDGSRALTHDAIASLFLNAVQIGVGETDAVLYRRKRGERDVQLEVVRGDIAKSQRPYVPMWGTIIMYFILAAISAGLQWKVHIGDVAKDLDAVLEILGKKKDPDTGVLNVAGVPLETIHSKFITERSGLASDDYFTVENIPNSNEIIASHNGFLPAKVLHNLLRYMKERETTAVDNPERFRGDWGIVYQDAQSHSSNV